MAKNDASMARAAYDHQKLCDLLESMKHSEILNWLPKTYLGTPAKRLEGICEAASELVKSQRALSKYYSREFSTAGRMYNTLLRWVSKCDMLEKRYKDLSLKAGTLKGRAQTLCEQQEASIATLETELESCVQERTQLECKAASKRSRMPYDPEIFQDKEWKNDMISCGRNNALTNLATRMQGLRLTITSIRASNETCKALYDTAHTIACVDSYAHAAINACSQVPREYCQNFEQLAKEAANLARKLKEDIARPSAPSPLPAFKLASTTATLQDITLKAAMP